MADGPIIARDTSLFPTAVRVNPMVTVIALAARVARTIDAEL